MKQPDLESCPLCHSHNLRAYKVGWSTIVCFNCHIRLSRDMPLADLIEIWNTRINDDNAGRTE